jgi:hypothetical protein
MLILAITIRHPSSVKWRLSSEKFNETNKGSKSLAFSGFDLSQEFIFYVPLYCP